MILYLLVIIAAVSCNRVPDNSDNNFKSELTIKGSASEFLDLRSGNISTENDPFVLEDLKIIGDSVYITVSYSGGCKQHSFEIVWSEELTETEPPSTSLIIVHNANGDNCEAYITETLLFSIDDLSESVSFDTICVNIINGTSVTDSLSVGGWNPSDTTDVGDDTYEIVFTEGNTCLVEVTARKVICGAGLYDNLWLALKDTVSTGIEGYFFGKYLQPVAIADELKSFVPVEGRKYLVGATIQKAHPYDAVIVCLAYSGPSVPVKINCITEIK
jgi:hypothetical protein